MAYRVEQIQTGFNDNISSEYVLVDPSGNAITKVTPTTDDYGNVTGYYLDNSTGGGEGGGMTSYTPLDLDAINARAAAGEVPFGTGMGQALGYEYTVANSEGNPFRKFDAQGNLTEFVDKDGKWQPASSFQPVGLQFNASIGNLETAYRSPNSPRANITESTAYSVNPYSEDQGGWLGEGGWKNLAALAAAGLTAGFAAPAIGAIQGATGLGAMGAGALYGGATGALSGAITGGGQGALKGGLIGAAGGALGGYMNGADVAQAFPVNVSDPSFSSTLSGLGSTTGDISAGFSNIGGLTSVGDYALGSAMPDSSNYLTQMGSTGAEAAAGFGFEPSGVVAEPFDPNSRILTAQEAENLMRYNILPADMQTPATYDWLETPKALLSGEYGGLIKGGLTLGALAAANALKPQQSTQTTDGGLSAAQLQAMVAGMPSMIGQYTAMANGTGQQAGGYNPSMGTSLANLFPNFTLPTQGPFYGAGRFGDSYAPAPLTTLV